MSPPPPPAPKRETKSPFHQNRPGGGWQWLGQRPVARNPNEVKSQKSKVKSQKSKSQKSEVTFDFWSSFMILLHV